jgi:glycine/D-amino acid oxidase-like deaminating enzyme
MPSLKAAEVLDHWVGLRPGRVRLRLELEELNQAGLQEAAEAAAAAQERAVEEPMRQGRGRVADGLKIVHCYGHGGSGLTLAWGTAGDAVQLALKALSTESC